MPVDPTADPKRHRPPVQKGSHRSRTRPDAILRRKAHRVSAKNVAIRLFKHCRMNPIRHSGVVCVNLL